MIRDSIGEASRCSSSKSRMSASTSQPSVLTVGATSCRSSTRLAMSALLLEVKRLTTVTLPPGREMLDTIPRFTGSPAMVAMMGTVFVADIAACTTFSVPAVTMTATLAASAALDEACLGESKFHAIETRRKTFGRAAAEEADNRH